MEHSVTRPCGHVETIDIDGSNKKVEASLSKLRKNGKCASCVLESELASAMQAREEVKAVSFPALIDTDVQIDWAETIRGRAWSNVRAISEKLETHIRYFKKHDKIRDAIECARRLREANVAFKRWLSNSSACWWIDNKDFIMDERHIEEIIVRKVTKNKPMFDEIKKTEVSLDGFVKLVGSDSQVKWASRIREGAVRNAMELKKTDSSLGEKIDKFISTWSGISESEWWIKNKDRFGIFALTERIGRS